MGRKILSIVFIIAAIILLNLSNKALATLHQNSGAAVIYITLFIISMVFAWVSVTSPVMPKAIPQIAAAPVQQKETGLKKSGFAIASLILGILSFIPIMGILLGILAIIFGFVFFKQFKEKKLGGMGMATAGIILGMLGTVFGLLYFLGVL